MVLDAQSRAVYFPLGDPYLRAFRAKSGLRATPFYKHIGLYAFRTDVLRAVTDLPQSALERPNRSNSCAGWRTDTIGVGISEVETVGIDTPEDLEKAERFAIKNE